MRKQKEQVQVRQGDVFLQPIREQDLPGGLREEQKSENGRLILMRGEATGHHHSVSSDTAMLMSINNETFLRVLKDTPLEHQEHAAIELKQGWYCMPTQMEYTPKELKRVVD